MPQEATVRSVSQAYRVIKQMRLQGWDVGEDYREAARTAVANHLEQRMDDARARFLSQLQVREGGDRANGSYSRHLLTEMGDVLLQVPRTRTWSAAVLLGAYARRSQSVDRAILACFLLGLSTRKVARALLPMLGEPVSAATVSNISKTLDAAVAAFHRRPLRQSYRVLIFEGGCSRERPGPAPCAGRCWWRWASATTSARRSSTFGRPTARAPRLGRRSSTTCTGAGSAARGWS